MTERELQRAVLQVAQLFGWRVAHFRPALTSCGWRTPVEGDGAGFPDLCLVRRRCLLFRELKSARGRVSIEQTAWLDALSAAGCDAAVWTPRDWTDGTIERALRHG